MSKESSVDQTQAERPYVFFLFKRLDKIYDAWDEDEYELALRRALRLAVGLPTDIKEAMASEKKEIRAALNKAYRSSGVDFFTTHVARNREARRVSAYYLEPFMDKMVRLLDDKDWLEKGALRPRFPEKRRLKVTA